jgi:hypothetical protein
MEAIHSSEMSILTGATWRHIPEDGVLQLTTVFVLSFEWDQTQLLLLENEL